MAELRRVFRAPGPPRLSAGPAVAPELAVRFRPSSVGVPALHLMRSGCLSHPGALAARTRSPWNTPASAQNAHGFAGPLARRPAGTQGRTVQRLPRPLHGTRARCLGRASRLLEAPAPRPVTLPVAPGDHGPGSEREGWRIPSCLSSHNSLLCSHNSRSGFCAFPSLRGGSAS